MISCKNVCYSYMTNSENQDGENGGRLFDINFEIKKGEFILLCGSSGSGKTTIARLLNGLIPHYYEGELRGSISLGGIEYKELSLFDISAQVGSVFQNPRSQFFNVDTTSEIAFAPENHGWDKDKILNRVDEVSQKLNIQNLMHRSIFALSGGEKQKIACASASAINPDLYVFDEPSSNLDAKAIEELRELLITLKSEGKTIVIAEHRLYYIYDLLDTVYYLKDGKITGDYSGDEFREMSEETRRNMGLRPCTLKGLSLIEPKQHKTSEQIWTIKNFGFKYKNSVASALSIEKATVRHARVTAVIGSNGAGKTTFSRCLSGLEKRAKGTLEFRAKTYATKQRIKECYMVMQDVNHQLFTESVLEEVLLSMPIENKEEAQNHLRDMNLTEFENRHPMSLSGGQKQRVAIASAIASERPIIIFDEPTSGLDLENMKRVSDCANKLAENGKTVIVVTHDPEFILRCCDEVIHIENGQVQDSYCPSDAIGREKLLSFFKESYRG